MIRGAKALAVEENLFRRDFVQAAAPATGGPEARNPLLKSLFYRALRLPTFSHLLIVNKLLSPILARAYMADAVCTTRTWRSITLFQARQPPSGARPIQAEGRRQTPPAQTLLSRHEPFRLHLLPEPHPRCPRRVQQLCRYPLHPSTAAAFLTHRRPIYLLAPTGTTQRPDVMQPPGPRSLPLCLPLLLLPPAPRVRATWLP